MVELPILPLRERVLFPKCDISIHVAQDTFSRSLHPAFLSNQPLGLIFAPKDQDGFEVKNNGKKVGCLGRVEGLEKIGFGRFILKIRGVRKFKVQRIIQDFPLLSVQPDYLEDEDFLWTKAEKIRAAGHLKNDLKKYSQHVLKLDANQWFQKFETLNLERLINQAASYLDVDLLDKQRLLEISSLEKRFHFIKRLLDESLAFLKFLEHRDYASLNPILN